MCQYFIVARSRSHLRVIILETVEKKWQFIYILYDHAIGHILKGGSSTNPHKTMRFHSAITVIPLDLNLFRLTSVILGHLRKLTRFLRGQQSNTLSMLISVILVQGFRCKTFKSGQHSAIFITLISVIELLPPNNRLRIWRQHSAILIIPVSVTLQ
jgi:hypothetical protein